MAEHIINVDALDVYSVNGSPYITTDGKADIINIVPQEISRDNLKAETLCMMPVPQDGTAGAAYGPQPAIQTPRVLVIKAARTSNEYAKKRLTGVVIKGKISEKVSNAQGYMSRGSYVFPYYIDDGPQAGGLFNESADENASVVLYRVRTFSWITKTDYNTLNFSGYFDGMTTGAVNTFTPTQEVQKKLIKTITEGNNTEIVISVAVCMTDNAVWDWKDPKTGTARVKFDVTEKPHIQLTYEDVLVKPKNLYPKSGSFVNKLTANTFGWGLDYDSNNVRDVIGQSSVVFRWRTIGSGTINELSVYGARKRIEVPAGTFTEDFEWQVIVTSDDGIVGTPSEWISATTTDSISAAKPQYPDQVSINGDVDNYFYWLHVIETGSVQSKYDLQYSADGGITWIALKTEVTEKTGTVVPANTFETGNILWRVRTYNTDGIAGAWSDVASITVRERPAAPGITTCTETPRPIIKWQSAEQQAYEIRAGDYKSGIIFGTEKEFKIPVFLSDGETEIAVRIIDRYGAYSDWAIAQIAINNGTEDELPLKTKGGEHVRIEWQGSNDIYYIYRDGFLAGKTTGRYFIDNEATGKHKYQVRGVTGDNYNMSAVLTEIARPKSAMISAIGEYEWVRLPYTGETSGHSFHQSSGTTLKHYSGRALPVAAISEYKDRTWTFGYRTKDRSVVEALNKMDGNFVIWKDRNYVRTGILSGLSITYTRVIDVSFIITECSREVMLYD